MASELWRELNRGYANSMNKEIKFSIKDSDIPRIRAGEGVEFVFEKADPTQADLINLTNDLMAVLISHKAYLQIKRARS